MLADAHISSLGYLWFFQSIFKSWYKQIRTSKILTHNILEDKLKLLCLIFSYEIMKTCWRENPFERPTFFYLSTLLEQLENAARVSMQHYGDDLE